MCSYIYIYIYIYINVYVYIYLGESYFQSEKLVLDQQIETLEEKLENSAVVWYGMVWCGVV